MSRGLGSIQLGLLKLLEDRSTKRSCDQLARLLFGERQVVRVRGRRHCSVAVPAGEVSNLRRALRHLVRRGLVQPYEDGPIRDNLARGRSLVLYALSDRFTCDGPASRVLVRSSAPLAEPPLLATGAFDRTCTQHHAASVSRSSCRASDDEREA